MKFRNLCMLLAACLVLYACGGGGDGPAGGYLSTSASSVTFSSFPYAPLPPSQTIEISWSSPDVAVFAFGYHPDAKPATWLDLKVDGDYSPLTLHFSVKSTSMPLGAYTTTVRILAGNINYDLLDVVDIEVSLILTDGLAISSGSALSFNMIHGGLAPQPRSVSLIGNGISWTATPSDSWLQLNQLAGITPSTLSLAVDPTEMAPGVYNATLDFVDDANGDVATLNVQLTIEPNRLVISGSPNRSFSMIYGGLGPQAQSVALDGNDIDWTASPDASWIRLSEQLGTSPSTLSIEVDPAGLIPGVYFATVDFEDHLNNETVTLNVQFTIEPNHLAISGGPNRSFSMIYGGLAPQAQSVTLDGNDIDWTASPDASWIRLSEQLGTSPSTLSIEVDPEGLIPGVYFATVDFEDHLNNESVTLNVQFTIEPNHLAISGGPNRSFSMIYGGLAPQAQSVTLDGNGINWAASSSVSWIRLSEQTGTSPSTLSIEVDPEGLIPGVYFTAVDFEDHLNNESVTLNVQFTIEPNQLAINSSSNLSFAMVNGGEWPYEEVVDLIGDGAYWMASASDPWVRLSIQNGTAPGSLSLRVDPTDVSPGIHNATVDFTDVYSDRTVTLNVQLSIEPHRLFVSDNGVAMAGMPSRSRLSYSVDVGENAGVSTPWTATSDQDWLSVTPDGYTGEPLSLNVDPAGLATDTIHYATVIVSSSDPSIEAPDFIRVGLWVGSSDPNPTDSLFLTYTEIAADPIRPLVYMHAGGADIDVYNVHTGGYVRTIAGVGTQLGDMEPSSDGSFLYVADLAGFQIVPIDLDEDEVGLPWNLSGSGNLFLAYGRNQGKPLIVTSSGSILDGETGSKFSPVFSVGGSYQSLAPNISQNGEVACGVRMSTSPYRIECYEVEYSALNGGILALSSLGAVYGPGGNANDLALTRDGSSVYVASASPYAFVKFDTNTMNQTTLPAAAYPNNVEIGSNDLLYGGVNSWYGPTDLWVYSPNGMKLADYYVSGSARQIRERQLVVSGDGLRIIVSTTDPKVMVLNSP